MTDRSTHQARAPGQPLSRSRGQASWQLCTTAQVQYRCQRPQLRPGLPLEKSHRAEPMIHHLRHEVSILGRQVEGMRRHQETRPHLRGIGRVHSSAVRGRLRLAG